MKTAIGIKLALAALALAAMACICESSNSGQKVGEVTRVSPTTAPRNKSEQTAVEIAPPISPTSTPVRTTTYAIGDIIQVEDGTIVLNSAGVQGNKFIANFTVGNNGSSDIAVSSVMSFSARDGEGTRLEQDWDCSPSLDGSVIPGDKLKGNVCWTGAPDKIKIYYEASWFGQGAVVWVLNK